MAVMNGQVHDARLPASAQMPLFTLPVHQEGPASSWPQQEEKSSPTSGVDGDTVIRVLAAVVVLAVAAFAAIVSYSHIFDLGRAHGQDGTAARLLPLSVDGLIAAASLVMLHAARNRLPRPRLADVALALGVGATIAANVAYGLPFGWLAAVVSAWPAVAFVVSVELAVRFVRDARHVATRGGADAAADDDTDASGSDEQRGSVGGKNRRQPLPKDRGQQQKTPSGSQRVRDILRRHPDLPKADVAERAGVSVRTVERVMSETRDTTAA